MGTTDAFTPFLQNSDPYNLNVTAETNTHSVHLLERKKEIKLQPSSVTETFSALFFWRVLSKDTLWPVGSMAECLKMKYFPPEGAGKLKKKTLGTLSDLIKMQWHKATVKESLQYNWHNSVPQEIKKSNQVISIKFFPEVSYFDEPQWKAEWRHL